MPIGRIHFIRTAAELRQLIKCPACGKYSGVANVADRGFRAEMVTLASHCSCTPAGPAYNLLPAMAEVQS